MKILVIILIIIISHCSVHAQWFYEDIPLEKSIFSTQKVVGKVKTDLIGQGSGMAMSYNNHGCFWIHNDSGGEPRIFLLTTDGELKAIVNLKGGVNNDWEDIAVGPGPEEGINYIYIGGMMIREDNQYSIGRIFRLKEPKIKSSDDIIEIMIDDFDEIKFKYPEQGFRYSYERRPNYKIYKDRKSDIYEDYYMFPRKKGMGMYYITMDAQNNQLQSNKMVKIFLPSHLVEYIYFKDDEIVIQAYDSKTYKWYYDHDKQRPLEVLQNEPDTVFDYPRVIKYSETVMVDPLTKDLYIISSRDDNLDLYRFVYPYATDTIIQPQKMGNLFKVKLRWEVNGGDISKDGSEILVKTRYPSGVYYWKREEQEPIYETLLNRKPKKLPFEPEPKGEAISFAPDGSGYYTTSEHHYQPIHFYQRIE